MVYRILIRSNFIGKFVVIIIVDIVDAFGKKLHTYNKTLDIYLASLIIRVHIALYTGTHVRQIKIFILRFIINEALNITVRK